MVEFCDVRLEPLAGAAPRARVDLLAIPSPRRCIHQNLRIAAETKVRNNPERQRLDLTSGGERAGCGQWVWGNSLSAGFPCTESLPMPASTLSLCFEMVFRRHVPPAQVPVLKTSTFDLMTRFTLIAKAPAEPSNRRSVETPGRSGKPSDRRNSLKPKMTTAPASGPGHKLSAVLGAAPGRRQARKRVRRSR